jgi:omega-6 fatty acid desaturase (delta-12 desaturase)
LTELLATPLERVDGGAGQARQARPPRQHANLKRIVGGFQAPILWRSLMQVATSFGGFLATLAAMYYLALEVSYWPALALAPLAAGFLVRIFIIQHDCGHASFSSSKRAMAVLGFLCSLCTLTPFTSWRRQHKGHHTIWNNLDRRQSGVDIYSTCLTVEEYRRLPPGQRWRYRLARHPLVANLLLPPMVFLLLYRLPFDMPKSWRRERREVVLTNLALLALYGGLGALVGFGTMLAVQLPVSIIAAIVGVGLFTLQHRGEGVVWARREAWDPASASLEGATYLRLPRVLQWFTGNIGFHHVHHLNHRVPNYRLQRAHEALAQHGPKVPTLSLWSGLKALHFALWDEGRNRMVTFREAAPAAA